MPDDAEEESLEPSENRVENNVTPPADGEVIPPPINPKYRGLKPFKKGQSGNPGGRPKRGPLSDALELIATKKTPEELLQKLPPSVAKVLGKKPTLAQILMIRLMYAAIAGDVGATRLIFERLEGKVQADVQTGDTGALDQLMDVLAQGGVPRGGVNE